MKTTHILITAALMIAAMGCKSSTNKAEHNVETESCTEESFTESTSTNTEYAIRLADETVLSRYSSYHGTIDEDSEFGVSVIIARTKVRDFIFFELSHENRWESEKPVNLGQNTIFQFGELTPEKPFVTDLLESWQRGFSYVDENNVRRFFSIEFDDNGSAYLLEFKARGR